MSLPSDSLSSTPITAAFRAPDSNPRVNLMEDFELGGIGINDPSAGLESVAWRGFSDGSSIWVEKLGVPGSQVLVTTDVGISEVSVSFDQTMKPMAAYVAGGVTKLYWYDSVLGGFTTTPFAGCATPMLTMDDKSKVATFSGVNDVLFVYIRAGALYFRQQRERYLVEHLLALLPPGSTRLAQVGMGTNNRLHFLLSSVPPVPALHADLGADDLYLAGGDNAVRALATGGDQEARWRSAVFVTDEQPSMGWARVDALAYPLTLNLFGDGGLVATRAVTSDDPFRLPAVRSREWQVELVSSARVLSVRLAETRQELEGDDANLSL